MTFLDMATDETVQLIRDALQQLQITARDAANKLDVIDEKVTFTNGKVSQAMRDIEASRGRINVLEKDFRAHVKWGETAERKLNESLRSLASEEKNNHEAVKFEKSQSLRIKEALIHYGLPALIAGAVAIVTVILAH